MFRELDVVRIVRLLALDRPVDGDVPASRQPRIGDVGAVVGVLDDRAFVVECVGADGRTEWIADFVAEELEKVT